MLMDPAISAALALSLAALFAATAAHKAVDFGRFINVVRAYGVMPAFLAPLASLMVIALEFAIAAGLVAPPFRAVAGSSAAALLLAYGVLIGFNIARNRRDIDCGCSFGGSGERLTPVLIFRNLGLAILALVTAAPVGARSLELLDAASITLFVLSSAALYVAFEGLRANAAGLYAAGGSR